MNAKKRRKLQFYKRLTAILLTVSIVTFVAVFFSFVPFRLLLPAYRVAARAEGELRLHFLDIEGGAVIVEFEDGGVTVINAGGGSYGDDNKLCRYLRGLKPSSLSVALINSEPRHVGGIPALMEAFKVDAVYLPASGPDSAQWEKCLAAVKKEGCRRETLSRYAVAGKSAGAYLVCLNPYSAEEEQSADASAIFYLSYAGVRAVLAGDESARREEKLAAEYGIYPEIFTRGEYPVNLKDVDLFSCCSYPAGTGEDFLTLLSPKLSVLVCSQNKGASDTALENLCARSEKVCRTDELGVTVLSVRSGKVTVTPHAI